MAFVRSKLVAVVEPWIDIDNNKGNFNMRTRDVLTLAFIFRFLCILQIDERREWRLSEI